MNFVDKRLGDIESRLSRHDVEILKIRHQIFDDVITGLKPSPECEPMAGHSCHLGAGSEKCPECNPEPEQLCPSVGLPECDPSCNHDPELECTCKECLNKFPPSPECEHPWHKLPTPKPMDYLYCPKCLDGLQMESSVDMVSIPRDVVQRWLNRPDEDTWCDIEDALRSALKQNGKDGKV